MSDPFNALTSALADRYTIERELGRGGAAAVFLATDLRHHRKVALKILSPEVARAVGAERFLREIEVAARLTHPHIVPLYDSGNASGVLYFVMPFVEGESLRVRLEREGALPVDDAVRIAREVADALAYAHARGVIHRDVKPENVLLEAGHAVLADFGVARALSEAGDERLTQTGVAVGTPAYMSPEQAAADREIDGRADQYAVGCLLYEMLTGQAPFTGPSSDSVMRQHLVATPVPVTQLRPSVPPEVAAALDKAMAKAPPDRFGCMEAFQAALQAGPVFATPSSGVLGALRRGWSWGLPVTVVAVGALVATVLLRPGTTADTGDGDGNGVEPEAATRAEDVRIAVLPFESRGSGVDLPVWGQVAADAIARAIDHSGMRVVVPDAEVRSVAANRIPASTSEWAAALGATHLLSGTLTGLGEEVRFDLELNGADGALVRGIDPVSGAAADIEQVIDVLAERAGGAVLMWTDPDWSPMLQLSPPPTIDVYHSLAEAFRAFHCREDWARSADLLEGILAKYPDYVPALLQLWSAYVNQGSQYLEERAAVDERLRLLVPGMTATERGWYDWGVSTGVDRLDAARRLIREDPRANSVGYALALAANAVLDFDLAMQGLAVEDYERTCAWVANWELRAHVHHMRGEYVAELHWARDGLARFAGSTPLHAAVVRALVALDSLESVGPAVESWVNLPGQTPGARYLDVAQELKVHGHGELSVVYEQEALRHYAEDPQTARYSVLTHAYYRQNWERLLPLAETLMADLEAPLSQRRFAEYGRVLALVGLGRREQAEQAQAQLIERHPLNRVRVALPIALGDVRGVVSELGVVLDNGGQLSGFNDRGLHLAPEWQPILRDPRFEAFILRVSTREGV